MKRKILYVLIAVVLLFVVFAGQRVKISIDPSIAGRHQFLFDSKVKFGLIHGYSFLPVEANFVSSAQVHVVQLFVNKTIVDGEIVVSLYHPLFEYDYQTASNSPNPFKRSITMQFSPRSWHEIIAGNEAVVTTGPGMHVDDVIGHFQLFITNYLLQADKQNVPIETEQISRLFNKLVAYTKEASKKSTYPEWISEKMRQDIQYAANIKAREQINIETLEHRLQEAHKLMVMTKDDRLRLYQLKSNIRQSADVYQQIMAPEDHRMINQFLEMQWEKKQENKEIDTTIKWTNASSHIGYSLDLIEPTSFRAEFGKPPLSCFRTKLLIDLRWTFSYMLGTNPRKRRINFCRIAKRDWQPEQAL